MFFRAPSSPGATQWVKTNRCIPRPVIIDSSCYLHTKEWISTGWPRLFTPSPSTNYDGVVRSELRYAIAYAMQNRVLSLLYIQESRVFCHLVTQYWTPHSVDNFVISYENMRDCLKWMECLIIRQICTNFAEDCHQYAKSRDTSNLLVQSRS